MHCWAIEALFDHLICAAQQRRRDRRNVGNERPYPCYATITLAAARLAAIGARELEHRVRDRARSRSEPHDPRRPSGRRWRTIRTTAVGWVPRVGRGKAVTSRPFVNALAPQHAGHRAEGPPRSSSPQGGFVSASPPTAERLSPARAPRPGPHGCARARFD